MHNLCVFFTLCFSLFLSGLQAQTVACNGTGLTQYPYQESFENPSLPDWTAYGSPGWLAFSGPTPDPLTGPSAASDGVLYQAVDLTTGSGSSILESPCYDLTGLTNPELSFDYHMFGPNVSRLFVQLSLNGGASWGGPNLTPLLVYGDQGNQWHTVTFPLSSLTSISNLRIRFISSGSTLQGDQGDMAIDNLKIEEAAACFDISVSFTNVSCSGAADGQATLLLFPANTTGLDINWSTGATNVSSISNLGPGNYSVVVTDNAGCTKTKNFSITESSTLDGELYITPASVGNADGRILMIPSGGTAPYSVQWLDGTTGTLYGAKPAGYTEVSITDANGCVKKFRTFLPEQTACQGTYSNFPYRQDFERNGLGQFRQGQDDDMNWRRKTGSTSTANTGPTAAGSGNQYRYLEASGSGAPFKSGTLYTRRCFDITRLAQPQLYFKYHQYGADAGAIFVQLSSDGGFTWRESVWTSVGDQGNQWKEAFISLDDYISPSLRIRIVGVTAAGPLGDLAIDDVRVKSANTPLRAVPTDIVDDAPALITGTEQSLEEAVLYPNPASDLFRINASTLDPLYLIVLDVNGRQVIERSDFQAGESIDVSALTPGLYLVRLRSENGETITRKLLKR